MTTEAVTAGFYEPEHFNGKYPRLQLLTIEDLLAGKQVQFPNRVSVPSSRPSGNTKTAAPCSC